MKSTFSVLLHHNSQRLICAAILAAAASFGAHAQTTYYWDQDATTPPTYLENGQFTTDPTGVDPAQVTFSYFGTVSAVDDLGNPANDLVFSSDIVGTEAQTIKLDSEYGQKGLIFNKGAISLVDDGSNKTSPNNSELDLGSDGITLGAGSGAVTLSPIAFQLIGSQSWANNSSQDLNINGSLTGNGTTITFNGTGAGAVRINGPISADVGINQTSATSTLYLANGSNGGVSSFTADGGTVVALNEGSIADKTINLTNGGTLTFQNQIQGSGVNQAVNVTNGGTLNFAGDTFLDWGNGNSNTVTADTLTLGTGDDLDFTQGAQHIGTLNLVAGPAFSRLLVGIGGQGYGLINGTTINVGSGYILDFGASGNQTVNNVINVANGGAIETRSNGTVTLSNVALPTAGTVALGGDDVSGGALNFTAPLALTGDLTIDETGQNTAIFLSGNISGNHGLTVTGADSRNYINASPVFLNGTNTYSGPTVLSESLFSGQPGSVPVLVINGDSSGVGNEFDDHDGYLIVESNGKMPTTAVVTMEASNQNAFFQIGDGGAPASATVAGIQTDNVNNGADEIMGGNAAVSVLTLDPTAGQVFQYNGNVGPSFFNNVGANLEIIKNGAGTEYFTNGGGNAYNGGTIINAGVMAVNGGANMNGSTIVTSSLGSGSVTINNGATLDVANGNLVNTITLGTQGTVTYSGDSYQAAGTIAGFNPFTNGGIDYLISGKFVGGGNLVVGNGDLLAVTSQAGTPGNIYVVGGRLLMLNNTTFIDGATSVTTADGGVLDFGTGGNPTTSVPILFGAGGAIEDRGTNITINNLQPVVGTSGNMPTLTIGTDDVGGGSITVTNSVHLAENIEVIGFERDNGFTGVNLAGGFSGTGNITYDTAALVNNFNTGNRGTIQVGGTSTYQGDTKIQGGIVDLTGDNTGVTSAGGGAPNYNIVATAKSFVDGNNNTQTIGTPGILQIGAGGSLASNANVVVGGSNGFAYFVLGDNNGAANVTIGNLSVQGNNNDNGAVLGGSSSISTLTVDVAANTTDTYAGIFGDSHGYNFFNTTDGNINSFENNLGVIFNIGAGGVMDLQGFNPGNSIAGGFVANGGTLRVDGNAGALASANVTLNGTDLVIGNNSYNPTNSSPHIFLGTNTNRIDAADGIDNFSGDVQSTATGNTVHVSGSNFIITSDNTQSTIGTLDIDGGRVFLDRPTGLNLIANGTVINVTNNAFLDLANSSTATITNVINFTSGTGLVSRNEGTSTIDTLTNALLPGSGDFTIGSDDEGGRFDSLTLSHDQVLTGNLALHVIGNSNVPVTLSGNISGTGGITEDSGGQGAGNLYLTGTNTYSGATSVDFANLFVDGNNTGAGLRYVSNFATLTIGSGGSIASNANLVFGNGGGFGVFVLGDANGAVNQTVASLTMESNGPGSALYNGNTGSSAKSSLNVNVTSGVDTYTGVLGSNSATNGNNLIFTKSGGGTLALNGVNTYNGGTTVAGGKLAVNGSIVGNATVNVGAEIGGSGSVGGTIGGAGAVGPGNSPGILTASSVDPTGGLSFNFEFSLLGSPNYANSSASGNDVLHLEGGSPFTAALTAANDINLYFAGAGDFEGGFFTNGLTDNLTTNIAAATYNFYVLDNAHGTIAYNGNLYDETTAIASTLPAVGANFGDGTVNGFTENFVVSGAVIPEPSTYALMGVGFLVLLAWRRRLKA